MLYFSVKHFLFISLLSLIPVVNGVNPADAIKNGETCYNHLRSKTEADSEGGSCMKEAFSQLNSTCANLDDAMVNYLALRFTVCHFQTLRRELPQECINATSSLESVSECTKLLPEVSFSIYTQFYTHTHASCFFLESTLWQERTQLTINKLGDVAVASAYIIEKSLDNSETLIKGQDVLQSKAAELSDKHDYLHDKMDTNHQKMDALTKNINEHYNMISDVLEVLSQSSVKLLEMVSMVLGETQQLSSFLFYFTLTLMTFLLTIPARTNGARLRMLSFIVLHFLLERLAFTVGSSLGLSTEYINLILLGIYYTRFFTVLLLSFLFIRSGYYYKDYEALLAVINTKLDEERNQNIKFREVIQNEIKVNSASLHDKFDRLTRPFTPLEDEELVPLSRRSIHGSRKPLEDSFNTPDCVSDYNTPWQSRYSDDHMFSPAVTLDYDSGVEDCSRKELQLSIHKLNVSTAGSSPASTPQRSMSTRSMTSSVKRYNLRPQK